MGSLVQLGRVDPIEERVCVDLAQEVRGSLEVLLGGLRPVGHTGSEIGQRIGVVRVVGDCDASLKLRVGEDTQRGDVGLLDALGIVGQHRVAPVEGQKPGGALVVVNEVLHRHDAGVQVVPTLDSGGVERLEQPGLAPFADGLGAGMRKISLEACA
jgi:hypothetical protein